MRSQFCAGGARKSKAPEPHIGNRSLRRARYTE